MTNNDQLKLASLDNRPLRVLMVTARYFPDMGGIETHVYEVARRMAKLGVAVTVLTTDRSGKQPKQEAVEGVEIERVPAYPRTRDYYYAPELRAIIAQKRWDIVHCQGFHTLVPPLAMRAAGHAKLPYVLTFHSGGHSIDWRNAIRTLQTKLIGGLLKHAAKLIGVSKFEAELFRARLGLSPDRFTVIPNGSNLPKLDTLPAIVDGTLILSVGRLEKYKGHQRIIEAFPQILAERPDALLRVLGVGPYEAPLQELVVKLNLSERVQIGAVPITDRQGMASVMTQASLITLLSDYEANPVSVMEALSLQRQVLVTDTSGFRELAEQGLVRAIPLESTPLEIAQAVLEQLRQPLAISQVSLPTWDDCAARLLTVYQQVLAHPQMGQTRTSP